MELSRSSLATTGLTGTPALLSDKVACVDYSVAKGGKLVAYRWDSEPFLENSKLDWVRL